MSRELWELGDGPTAVQANDWDPTRLWKRDDPAAKAVRPRGCAAIASAVPGTVPAFFCGACSAYRQTLGKLPSAATLERLRKAHKG